MTKRRKASRRRRLRAESLEPRRLLAVDWQNPFNPLDVNDDGLVTPFDALAGINRLNLGFGAEFPDPSTAPPYYDANQDCLHTPFDVLVVVNALNKVQPPPDLDLALFRDTAPDQATNNDLLTSDSRIAGTTSAVLGVLLLKARIDGGPAQDVDFDRAGNFLFDPAFATDGSDDGLHTVSITATDTASSQTTVDLQFTLDTQGPSPLSLGLAPEFVVGEDTTDSDIVDLVGQTIANTAVRLSPGDVLRTSGATGDFRFDQVSLDLGTNDFIVTATDMAGNTSATNKTITRISNVTAVLFEHQRFVTEASTLVELGQNEGTRQLRFSVETVFDRSDANSAVGDVLAIYLVDPNDPTQTLLDRGQPGTALFLQGENLLEYPPGLVTFDGDVVEIEVSSLASRNEGLLVFQLLNHDTDTETRATIGRISNEVDPDGFASPVFPLLPARAVPGGSVGDLSGLTAVQNVDVLVDNVRFVSTSGRYAADVRLRNRGNDLSQQISVTFPQTASSITMTNRSGLAADGSPYVNMAGAIVAGGLATGATSEAVTIEFTNPNAIPEILKVAPQVFIGGLNSPPTLGNIGTLTMTAGQRLAFQLDANDVDGNMLSFSMFSSDSLPPGALNGNGLLLFTPGPDAVGTFEFVVVVSDGTTTISQPATLQVLADPSGVTRITGRVIEEEDDDPIGDVPIELDEIEVATDDMGKFELEIAMPGDLTPSPQLVIHGAAATGPDVFPSLAEDLALLLDGPLRIGVENPIGRPIYLPKIDTQNAVPIDPVADTIVDTPLVPGAKLFVGAGTLEDGQGELYSGDFGITEVARARTPAALPDNVLPDVVVTLQPGGLTFTTPAPLVLPNEAGHPVGTKFDLMSIDPATGQFDVVGVGQVASDGSVIETITGGVRNPSWHFFVPRPAVPTDVASNVRNVSNICGECQEVVSGGAEIELHAGTLRETHSLVSHNSLGADRGLMLVYDSLRADPRPILHFGYDDVSGSAEDRLAANLVIHQGEFSTEAPGRPSEDLGLSSAENFWSLPAGGGDVDVALQVDLRSQPSGLYDYDLTTGLLRSQNGEFNGARSTQSGTLVHVNTAHSPFGAGWGLAGWLQVVSNPDGSVLLIDGDGSESVFAPPVAPGQPFVSPRGDFSTLVQMPDDTFRRTTTDQTVYSFNSDDLLASIVDRHGNETRFEYTAARLSKIVDPVGLETTFTYTGDRVTSIDHPAIRTTTLEYDGHGNMIRITDPDTSAREFEYDAKSLLTAEVTKRGFRAETVYDFAGRVVKRVEADGGEINVAPLQIQGLLPPAQTLDPVSSPPATLLEPPIAFHTDGNGNTVATELDRFGQRVFSFDGEGNRDRLVRDSANQVTAVVDPRGFTTRYEYDSLGNVTSISGDATAGSSPETATNVGPLLGTRTFAGVVGNLNPDEFYRFELEEASQVRVRLTGMVEESRVSLLADVNGDGVVALTEVLETAVFDIHANAIYEQLPPGSYFVRIQPDSFPDGQNTNYSLELHATELAVTTLGDPGGTLDTATNLGSIQTPQTVRDISGSLDSADVFEFDVAQDNSGVWIRVSQLAEDVTLRLIQDLDGDGVVDSGDVLRSLTTGSAFASQIFATLDSGTYFVDVRPDTFPEGANSFYQLEVEIENPPAGPAHIDNGNFLGNAMDVGALGSTVVLEGSLGGDDTDDFVKFTLNQATSVRAQITGLTADARVGIVADINGNLQLDSADLIEASQFSASTDPEWVDEELAPGDYFARVFQDRFDAKLPADYTLEIIPTPTPADTPADPGEFFATALNLDPFNGKRQFRDNVGSLDRFDYYKFTLTESATVRAELSELDEDIELGLVADMNGNGVLDSEDTIEVSTRGGKSSELLEEQLPAGTYFFQVFQARFDEQENSNYLLELDIQSAPTTTAADPGNNLATALDINPLDGPASFEDSAGSLDTRDFYTFTLADTATVSVELHGLNEDLDLALIADVNNDGIWGSGETLEASVLVGKSGEWVGEELSPGTYFVAVYQDRFKQASNSHYQLDVDITLVPTSTVMDPGNDLASALPIDPANGPLSIRENVGSLDRFDYYEFTLATASTVTVGLSELDEDLDLAIVADVNGNGIHNSEDNAETSFRTGKSREHVREELPPGTYYVLVYQDRFKEAANSHYVLDVSVSEELLSPAADPGNTLAAAHVIDPLQGAQSFRQTVGSLDKLDYYKFTLTSHTRVQADLTGLDEDLDFSLVADLNADGIHVSAGIIDVSAFSGKSREYVDDQLVPGTYFLLVYQDRFKEASNSFYQLDVDFTAVAPVRPTDPGNTPGTAEDLDALFTDQSVADVAGSFDTQDYYQFSLFSASTVQLVLDGLNENLELALVQDTGDGELQAGEVIATSARAAKETESLVLDLAAGTYQARVYQDRFETGSNSHYTLDIRFPTPASFNLGDPGSTLATAQDLGPLVGPVARTDFVGDTDDADIYKFQLDEPQQVHVSLFGMTQDADFWIIADRNGNSAIDSGDVIESINTGGAAAAFQSEDLGAGDYFVRVFQPDFPANQNTDYTLEITSSALPISPPQDPGNTLAAAQDLGQLVGPVLITEFVGSLDTADVFRFEIAQQSEIRVRLDDLVEEAAVSIIADANANFAIENGEIIESAVASGSTRLIQTEVLPPGVYYLQISPDTFPDGQNTRYMLDLTAVAVAKTTPRDPGAVLASALDIGPLTSGTRLAQQAFADAIGNLDSADFFRFQLAEAGELRLTLDGLSEDVQLAVIADTNGNFAIDAGESIESTVSSGEAAIVMTEFLPPGEYYARVSRDTFPDGQNSAYDLSIEFLGAGHTTATDPGNTLSTALPIDLQSPLDLREAIGDLDPVDLYQFTLAQAAELRIRLDDLHEDAIFSLIADVNNNGAVDSGETIETATSSGVFPLVMSEVVSAGTYFLRVSRDTFPDGQNTLYKLSVLANPLEATIGARTFTYEPHFSQLTSETDELGRLTRFDVDPANGNILAVERLVGLPDDTSGETDDVVTRFTYTAAGQVETVTDPLLRVTRNQYNALGRLEMIRFAEGTADEADQHYDYNLAGNLDEVTDENGNVTAFTYDGLNRLLTVTEPDPDGGGPLTELVTQFVYDDAGNLGTVVEPTVSTQFTYDQRDRLVRIEAPQSRITQFDYDFAGNLITTTDPLAGVIRQRYDERNRLVATLNPLLKSTRYRYDQDDNLVRHTDPLDNVTQFTYDSRDRLISMTDPLDNVTTYEYDAVGNRVATRDRNDRLTTFEYDELDRLSEEVWFLPGGATDNAIGYEYDKAGNVLEANDAYDSLTFSYDNRDRPLTTQGLALPDYPHVTLTYGYDGVGNVLSVAEQIGSPAAAAGTTTSQYNARNQVTLVTQSGTNTLDKRVDFTYDRLGRVESIERFTDLLGTGGAAVAETSLVYESAVPQRVAQITHGETGSPLADYLYTYDTLDRIASVTDLDGSATYSYDAAGQLVSATYTDPTQSSATYGHDAAGNRVLADGDIAVFSAGNRLQSDGEFTYQYDLEGNVVRRTEIVGGDFVELSYDNRNRLTQTIQRAAGGQETGRIDYTYDALNRRITERADNTVDEVLRYFAYDRGDVLLTFLDSDGDGPAPTQLNQRFLNGPVVDQVLAEESFGGVDWYLSDALGTVRDRIESTGNIADHIKYDAFGQVVSETNPGEAPLIGYAGGRRDMNTGLTYLRNRYYDPQAGRFLSPDPLGHAAGGPNVYAYALNDPVNNADPTGLIVPQLAAGSAQLQSLLFNRIAVGGRLDIPHVAADSTDSLTLFNRNTLLSSGTNALKSPFGPHVWQAYATTGSVAGQANRSLVPGAAARTADPWYVFAATGALARGTSRALTDALLVGGQASDALLPGAAWGFVVEFSPLGLFFGTLDRQVSRVR